MSATLTTEHGRMLDIQKFSQSPDEMRKELEKRLNISTENIEVRLIDGISKKLGMKSEVFLITDTNLIREQIESQLNKSIEKAQFFHESPFSARGSIYLALRRFLTYKPW